MRAWVENWKRLGPEMERMEREELRAKTERAAYADAVILSASSAARPDSLPEATPDSGLVTQQQIFQKARDRK